MTVYYWETEISSGKFTAENDKEAIRRQPKGSIVLYKESDTPDGTPFILIDEK